MSAPIDRMNRPPGKVITFYSYKGGTGRSMSLANVAWILASAGNRVLAIDWDLEAPGLHRYFSPFLRDKKLGATEGIINFADEYRKKTMTPPADRQTLAEDWYLAHADLSHYAVRLEWDFDNGGYLDFVPAGQQDEDYSPLVNSFNWKTFFTDLGGNRLLDATKDKLRADYDYILIDSRTGVSDTSGICTVKMPDILVVCFTLNNQGIEGAASVANSVHEQRGDGVKIFPVPMRLDNGELKKLEARFEQCKRQFFQFPNAEKISKKQYWNEVPVNYVTYYAYEEVLAAFGEKDVKIVSLLASAERLTSYLTDGQVAKLMPPPEWLRLKKLSEYEGREIQATPADKVSEAAQIAFRRFSIEQQDAARHVLLRLVRVPGPEEKAELSRKRVPLPDLGAGAYPLLRKLLDAQLIQLVGEDEQGDAVIEIINDELLLNWKELRKWIDDDLSFLLWRQQLRADMAEWRAAGRANNKLLDGRFGSQTRKWLKKSPDLNADETEFVRASISRVNRRLVVVAVFVVLIMATFIGYRLRQRSVDSADAQRLATEAQKHVDAGLVSEPKDPNEVQLGALLALESERLAPSQAATIALNRALAVLPRSVASFKYNEDVRNAAWSSDGRYITTIRGRASNIDLDAATVPTTLSREVFAAQLSRLSRDEDRVVEMREVATNQRLAGQISFKPGVLDFSLSHGGRYVGFLRVPGELKAPYLFAIELLDVLKSEPHDIDQRLRPVSSMIFSPDSRLMIEVGNESTAVLVDVGSAKVLKKLTGHRGPVNTAAFSPDSSLVATVSNDYYARVWRVSDPEGAPPVREFNLYGAASKVLFTPDGKYLVTMLGLSGRKDAQIWEWMNPKKQWISLNHGSIIRDVAVSADGNYLATLGEDREICVWETRKALNMLQSAAGDSSTNNPSGTLEKSDAVHLSASGNADQIAFGPGRETYLAATGDSPVAVVWKAPDFSVAALLTHEGKLNDILFAPDGHTIAMTSANDTLRIWQIGVESTTEPCQRLRRNLTAAEWNRYLLNRPYRLTCPDITNTSP